MKFDGMKPAPPVTRTRFTLTGRSKLSVDRVEGAPFDVPLDPSEIFTDERQDESLDPEHEQHRDPAEERPREVRAVDPVDDPVDPESEREQRARGAERDADPLDRLRPEAGEDVEREPRQAQR